MKGLKKGILILFLLAILLSYTYSAQDYTNYKESFQVNQITTSDELIISSQQNKAGVIYNEEGVMFKGYYIPDGTLFTPKNFFDTISEKYIIGPFETRYMGVSIAIEDESRVKEAEELIIESNGKKYKGRKLSGIDYQANNYVVKYAGEWKTGSHTVLKGENIQKEERTFYVEYAETIRGQGVFNNVSDYEHDDGRINVGSASEVSIDSAVFNKIKGSSFRLQNSVIIEADITSDINNNVFEFEGIYIKLDKDDYFSFSKNPLTNKYHLTIESDSGLIKAKNENIACIIIGPGSTFEYTGKENKKYILYIPPDEEPYKLCIKTQEGEEYDSDCGQCGVFNSINGDVELNGEYELDIIEEEQEEEEIYVESSEEIIIDSTDFQHIKDSTFKIEDGEIIEAEITSDIDDNSFEFNDITFKLSRDDKAIISRDEDTGKYNMSIESIEGIIESRNENVSCVLISPGSRYNYVGEEHEKYAVYIPYFASEFKLCIKTLEDEEYDNECSQCGIVDLINGKFELKGNYEFEKENKMIANIFSNVINGGIANYTITSNTGSINNSYIKLTDEESEVIFSYFRLKEELLDEGNNRRTCAYTSDFMNNQMIFNEYENKNLMSVKGTMNRIWIGNVNVFGPGNLNEIKAYANEIEQKIPS